MKASNGLPSGNYLIQIRSGRHAGAEIPLAAGTYMVGAGNNADIVLTDDGIAAGHVELRFEGEFCRVWSLDGAVRLPGRQLNPGARADARLPADIAVAGVELGLIAPVLPRKGAGMWRRPALFIFAGMIVIATGVGLVVSGSVPAFSTPTVPIPASVTSSSASPGEAAISNEVVVSPVIAIGTAVPPQGAPANQINEADEAARALRGRIAQAGLAGRVAVSISGNVVEAGGILAPDRQKDWMQLQMWYDQTYKGRVPLVHHVRFAADAAAPQLTIQAIWAGAGPYVIGADGEKYGEGATLPGGWRVERIERSQVLVSKGEEKVALVP